MIPEGEVGDLLGGVDVVVDGDPGHLHDARLDGIHERKVAHHPREDEPLLVAGAPQVEGSGGEVVDGLHPDPLGHGAQAPEPHPSALVALLRLPPCLRVELDIHSVVVERLVLVAVMRLVVEHEDLALATTREVTQHPVDHLLLGLHEGIDLAGVPGPQQLAGGGRDALDLLRDLGKEGVVVRDDDGGVLDRRA